MDTTNPPALCSPACSPTDPEIKSWTLGSRFTFTLPTCRSAPKPMSGRVTYSDSKQAGLVLRVTAAGARVFYCRRRVSGRAGGMWVRLGSLEEMHPEDARRRAAGDVVPSIMAGHDPNAERRAVREAEKPPTLADAWERHRLAASGRVRASTWQNYEGSWKRHIEPAFGSKPLKNLDGRAIERWHAEVGKRSGIYEANNAFRVLRRALNLAYKWEMIARVPTVGIEQFQHLHRERVPTADEMTRLWKAIGQEADPSLRDYLRMMILTGQRRTCVARMRFVDVEMTTATWIVPAAEAKGKRAIVVPLLPAAVAIIAGRREMVTEGCEWVFESSQRPGLPIKDPKKAWARACALAGITGLRLHDLRRWFASALVSNGVSLQAASKLLGHASPAVTALVYAHLSDASTRDAIGKLPVPV